MSETKTAEEKLAILIRELYDFYQDGSYVEPTDIEGAFIKAELGEMMPATEEDANQMEDVEVGDELFSLTKETLDMLEKYNNE